MDQFAFHDIPDTIDYILDTSKQQSLSYIGFSQGTAQAFAALSVHPALNDKIDVFVALAPAMAPPGLASGIVASFVKTSPEVLYLVFGRKAILGSAAMWQALLYPGIFVYFIDKSLRFLFGWKAENITAHQKLAAYPHLYSFSSVKTVVHWFQIIRNGTFQMFDDEVAKPLAMSNGNKYYKVAKFPTRNIKTPIVLVYGGSDSLVDINLMLKELPRHTVAKCIPKYEHLDFLWASDVDSLVFPHVLEALESYAQPSDTKAQRLGWRGVERGILERALLPAQNGSQPPRYSDDERSRRTDEGLRRRSEAFAWGVEDVPTAAEEQLDESEDEDSTPEHFALTPKPGTSPLPPRSREMRSPTMHSEAGSTATVVPQPASRLNVNKRTRYPRPASGGPTSPLTAEALSDVTVRATNKPEGWWSSSSNTEEAGTTPIEEREAIIAQEEPVGEAFGDGSPRSPGWKKRIRERGDEGVRELHS